MAELEPITGDRQRLLGEAISRYTEALHHDVNGAQYLISRGFTRQIAERFRLGVVRGPMAGHQKYEGMLAIPYLDGLGEPLTVRFRCISEHDHRAYHHGKYNSLPHDPGRLYNVGALHRAEDVVHLTEGEVDAMTLEVCGLPAVALPGAHAFMARHRKMLAGFSRVYVWGDPDDAGSEMVSKVMSSLRQAVPVNLIDGDVNETFIGQGKAGVLSLLERGR